MKNKLLSLTVLSTVLLIGIAMLPPKALADVVTCNDGSVHSSPTADYACVGPGEGGVRSVAPNSDQASKPGDVCPDNFANAGKKIPAGSDGSWCNIASQSVQAVKSDCQGNTITAGAPEGDTNHCGILDYLIIGTNFLSGLVGVVVLAMIIIGGIQYSSAGDDPQKVAAAKSKITNAILALVIFFFMFAFLQWLIPGGIF